MSSMTFGQKSFQPTPPDKGSFPLDHEACRKEAKEYLSCRMDNNLMAKEEWTKLGFTSEDVSNKQ